MINLDNARIQKQQNFDTCYSKTLLMTAEQAFTRFDK